MTYSPLCLSLSHTHNVVPTVQDVSPVSLQELNDGRILKGVCTLQSLRELNVGCIF